MGKEERRRTERGCGELDLEDAAVPDVDVGEVRVVEGYRRDAAGQRRRLDDAWRRKQRDALSAPPIRQGGFVGGVPESCQLRVMAGRCVLMESASSQPGRSRASNASTCSRRSGLSQPSARPPPLPAAHTHSHTSVWGLAGGAPRARGWPRRPARTGRTSRSGRACRQPSSCSGPARAGAWAARATRAPGRGGAGAGLEGRCRGGREEGRRGTRGAGASRVAGTVERRRPGWPRKE